MKKRLVGIAVLLLLAVIVLPLVLDGANEDALLADTRLPPPPAVPEAAALLDAPPAELAAAEGGIARDHVPAEPEPVVAPVVPPVAIAPAAAAPSAVPAATASATAPPASAAAVEPVPAPADPRLAALAEAWDVQVAAVSSPDGAERLRSQLAKAGYKARIVRAGGLHKVVVGPELRRAAAEKLRDRMAADARVGKPKGMLVRYVP